MKYQTYDTANIEIENFVDCDNPDIILCATGDYMLDQIVKVYKILNEDGIQAKIVYVTNPKILDVESKKALSDTDFYKYFVLIKYRTYGNIYNIRCNVLNTSDLSSDYVYIEVPSSIINANKIEFVINNRENKYNLVLK